MKKLGVFFIGANLLFSLQVNASSVTKKRRSFDCQSDNKISGLYKKSRSNVSEYLAVVTELEGSQVNFLVKKNYLLKNELRTQTLTNEKSHMDSSQKYLTIQGNEWALAIAPEKKRASLYNMNPDVNEVPMFCLSPQ